MSDPHLLIYKSTFLPFNPDHWFCRALISITEQPHIKTITWVATPQQKTWLLQTLYASTPENKLLPEIYTLDEWLLQFVPFEINFTQPIQRLCLHQTIQELHQKKQWYSPLIETQGFYTHFLQFYRNMKDQNIPPQSSQLFTSAKKTEQVWALYEKFEQQKKKAGLFGLHDVYKYLHQDPTPIQSEWETYEQAFFLGFDQIRPYQTPVATHLLETGASSSFLIHFDETSALYDAAKPTFSWLMNLNIPQKNIITPPTLAPQSPKLPIGQFKDIEQEILSIAESIMTTQHTTPLNWHDISIIIPNLAEYGPVLQKICSLFKIPINLHSRSQIGLTGSGPTGIIQFIQAFLEMNAQLSSNTLLTFLDSPFVTRIQSTPPNPPLLLNHPLLQTLIQTINWQHSLSKIKSAITQRCQTIIQNIENTITQVPFENPAEFQAELHSHASFCTQLIDHITQCRQSRTPNQQSQALNKLLHYFCIHPQHIHTFPAAHHTAYTETLTAIDLFLETYANLFTRNTPHLFINPTKLSKSFRLFFQGFTPSPGLQTGVNIYKKSDGYGTGSRACYICGFTAKNWPDLPQPNLFFTHSLPHLQDWYSLNHNETQAYFELGFALQSTSSAHISTIQTDKTSPPTLSYLYRQLQIHLNITPTLFPLQDPPLTGIEDALWLKYKSTLPTPSHSTFEHLPELAPLLAHHTYSVSQLDSYQRCPYYFYNRYILKLDAEDDIQLDISHLEWGRFFHQILCDYYTQLRDTHQTCSTENAAACYELITQITRQLFKTQTEKNIFWDIKKRQLLGANNDGLLWHFIQYDSENELPLLPQLMEHPFHIQSLPTSPPTSMAIKGTIDLILTDKTKTRTIIADFKTSSTLPANTTAKDFSRLQLPLYLLAMQTERPHATPAGAFYYQLHSKHKLRRQVLIANPEDKTELFNLKRERPVPLDPTYFNALSEHLVQLKHTIETGAISANTPHTTPKAYRDRTQLCRTCPYQFACSYPKRFESD